MICEINRGSPKGLRRRLQIWVTAKMISTCNSNVGRKDFIGVLPLFRPPQTPSEAIWGGASKQTVLAVSLNFVTEKNKVSLELTFILVAS